MNDSEAVTLEQVEKFLKASKGWKFKGLTRDDRYKWLDSAIRRFDYYSRRKKEKGLLRRYMMLITGFHEAQLDRLIQQKLSTGGIKAAWGQRNKFPITYTKEDIELLAETDNLHSRLAGPATKDILEREFEFGDVRYKRLSGISVSHIYNLRERPAYKFKALTVSRTKSVQVAIGKRGKPNPDGKPGHLRVDTVHQGDLNGVKGVYHINMVDEVTQWQVGPAWRR